jgi:glycosyltransferase involved in cell wall biosynthesis
MTTAAYRVALVVANPGLIDSRVVKYATSIAEAGYDVRVLCHSWDQERHEIDHGGALYVQLPVPSRPAHRNTVAREVARYWGKARRVSRRAVEGLSTRLVPDRAGSGLGSPIRRLELATYRRFPQLAPWRRVCRVSSAMTPVLHRELDAFSPSLVHQHDVHELNATASWVSHRRRAGDRVALVYDAREYVIGQPNPPARQVVAYASMEREFIHVADRVIVVSAPIADQLTRDYRLANPPDVVLNATWAATDPHSSRVPPLRQVAGLGGDVPLLVYIGGLAPARGVHTVVRALRTLPGVHLAVVSRAESSYTRLLRRIADDGAVSDRLHILPFVEPDQVVSYLTGCDIGLSPLLHAPNHDWALTNKFFEYLQAGLAIVTSDTPVQADLVRLHRLGTVFRAGDVTDCATAIRLALRDLAALKAGASPELLTRFNWSEEARVLLDVYRGLLPPAPTPPVTNPSLA